MLSTKIIHVKLRTSLERIERTVIVNVNIYIEYDLWFPLDDIFVAIGIQIHQTLIFTIRLQSKRSPTNHKKSSLFHCSKEYLLFIISRSRTCDCDIIYSFQ